MAAPQSGSAISPAPMYATNTAASASNRCSTRWKLPSSTMDGHQRCGDRHRHVAAHAEKFRTGSDPGELRGRGADVRDHQREQRDQAHADAVPMPDQADQALPGHHAHARPEVVEQHQRHCGEQKHPQQVIPVLGAQH